MTHNIATGARGMVTLLGLVTLGCTLCENHTTIRESASCCYSCLSSGISTYNLFDCKNEIINFYIYILQIWFAGEEIIKMKVLIRRVSYVLVDYFPLVSHSK